MEQRHICRRCGAASRPTARFCGRCGELLLPHTTISAGGPTTPSFSAEPLVGQLAPGTAIDPAARYRVVRLLGKGGFGEAYLAHDTHLRRACVAKRLIVRPQWPEQTAALARERFAHEARLLISLNTPGHPAIPEIYDYFPESATLVMKYVAGVSFAEILAQSPGGIAEAAALAAIRTVCDALVYMHQHRPEPVIHRDIKPANILRDADQRVWLIDFGLAQAVSGSAREAGHSPAEVIGTPAFMAPEQWRGHAGPRSDVYALAVTIWSLLTGRRVPSSHQPGGAADQPDQSLRPEVARLIAAALAEEAADRPDTRALRTELDALLLGRRTPASPPPPPAPPAIQLIGRAEDLAALAPQLRERRYVCITGIAGIGKTALAQALAYQGIEPRQVFWHTFRAGQQATALIWPLAAFLSWHGIGELWRVVAGADKAATPPPPPEALIDYAVQMLRERHVRCCLDDVQHVEGDPLFQQLVRGLRESPQAARCELIVVSRQMPQLLDYTYTAPLAGLSLAATAELLAAQRLRLAPEVVALLHSQTGGSPQLLLLVIDALLHTNDHTRLAQQIAATDQIEGYILGEVDRHLDDRERALLRALAVLFDEGGDRDALEQMLEAGGLRRALDSLSRRHLVQIRGNDGRREYALHAIIRAFYYADLSAHERRALHLRAAAHYAARDRLRAARHYAAAERYAAAAALALGDLWGPVNQGRGGDLAALLDQIPAQALAPAEQVALHTRRGDLAMQRNQGGPAEAHYAEALRALDGVADGPARPIAYAQICLGMGELLEQARPAEALDWLRRGEAAVAALDPAAAAPLALRIGSVLIGRGAYGPARDTLERCLQLAPADAEQLRASALLKLGTIDCAQGRSAQGQGRYRAALAIFERHRNHWATIGIRHNLAIEMEIAGDWAGAETAYLQALALAEQLGNRARRAHLELSLGILKTNQGEVAAARHYLHSGAELAAALGLGELAVAYSASRADLLLRQGDLAQAEPLLGEAEQNVHDLDSQYQMPEIQRGWALLALGRGDWAQAHARATQAVRLAQELEEPIAEGVSLRVLGLVLAQRDAPAAAAQLARSLDLLVGQDPYEAARTQAAWGRLLRGAGDPAGAQPLLDTARATFARLGARGDLQELEDR